MASLHILLVLLAASGLASPTASAGTTAQPLAEALSDFAARSGLQIVYVSEAVVSLRANAVPPGLAPDETLERLLRGTGLRFEYLNPRTVRIFADGEHRRVTTGEAASTGAATPAQRDAGGSARLDEILVTATHKVEWASDVPLSLTVWSQEAMKVSGAKGIVEIGALTPGLSFDWRSNLGAGVYTNLTMRGITGTHGVSTGVFIDDTRFPSATNDSYRRAFPSTFDLERVEVLRGAQGMLLGQGTLGGAIRFITTPPSLTEFSGEAKAEMATTEGGAPSYEAGASAGGPVIDGVLGVRVGGWYRFEGGFVDRIDPLAPAGLEHDINGLTSKSGRLGAGWMPSEATRMTATLMYDSNRADDPATFSLNLSDPAHGIFRLASAIHQPRDDRFSLSSIKLEHWSDTVNFLAVSSYIDRSHRSIYDVNCYDCGEPPFDFVVEGAQRTLQQELRLASAEPEARLSWLAGAHLSRTESTERLGVDFLPRDERDGTRTEQTQIEGYLEISGMLGQHLEASAGARVARSNYDYVSLPAPVFRGGDNETLVIPRFDVSYRSKSGNLYYLTAAKGYGGGYVVGVIPGCEPLELKADTVWNYELGAKADIFGGRAYLEASVFDARWGNRQHEPVAIWCLTSFQKGRAKSDGFELSGHARVGERTTIGLQVSYVDARYTESVESDGTVIVHAGDAVHDGRLPWSLSAFFDHDLPPIHGTIVSLHVEDHYHGGESRPRLEDNPDSWFYQAFGNADAKTNILNLRADAKVGPADIAVFVTNALDSSPVLSRFRAFGTGYTLTPRTVGVSAAWRF